MSGANERPLNQSSHYPITHSILCCRSTWRLQCKALSVSKTQTHRWPRSHSQEFMAASLAMHHIHDICMLLTHLGRSSLEPSMTFPAILYVSGFSFSCGGADNSSRGKLSSFLIFSDTSQIPSKEGINSPNKHGCICTLIMLAIFWDCVCKAAMPKYVI